MQAFSMLWDNRLLLLTSRLKKGAEDSMQRFFERVRLCESKVNAYSVQSVLDRGYALIVDESSQTNINSAFYLGTGQSVRMILKDGYASADVTRVYRQEGEENG